MKNIKLYRGFIGLLVAGSLAACSEDYLQVSPVTDLGTSLIAESVEGANVALNGLCRAMYDGYSVGANQNVGETYINTVFNDTYGPDVFGNLTSQYFSVTNFNWGAMSNNNTWYTQVLWMYPYNLINQANMIIENVTDETTGSEAEKNFVVAQARTIRAHAYIKLLQFYAPRWEDSNNGATLVCVLRKVSGSENLPLSSMKDVLDFIYQDLDEAIRLYEAAPGVSRVDVWAPEKGVAQGLYARAALIKHDWAKAKQMAHDARQGYRLRNAQELFEGFVEPTADDMWGSTNDPNSTVGYWSWGVHFACNGRYTQTWQLGTNSINMDLYRQLDPNDIRRNWFMTPDKIAETVAYQPGLAAFNLKEDDFWNASYMRTSDMRLNGALLTLSAYYSMHQFDDVNTASDKSDWYMPYLLVNGSQIGICPVFFGSQYKFWGKGGYSAMTYPYMRCSEMVLAEAEAAYMAQDETTAKACLEELNSLRIPGYSCDKTGSALLDEIRLTRRIELWGEGQNWSDFKRWNLPCVRRAWVAGDNTSGNVPAPYGVNIATDAHNGWRWALSRTETDYNPVIKPEEFLK